MDECVCKATTNQIAAIKVQWVCPILRQTKWNILKTNRRRVVQTSSAVWIPFFVSSSFCSHILFHFFVIFCYSTAGLSSARFDPFVQLLCMIGRVTLTLKVLEIITEEGKKIDEFIPHEMFHMRFSFFFVRFIFLSFFHHFAFIPCTTRIKTRTQYEERGIKYSFHKGGDKTRNCHRKR